MRTDQRVHRHGCTKCRSTYEDSCDQHSVNLLCWKCRTGKPGLYDVLETYKARECCYTNCRLARKAKHADLNEVGTYRLSPGCPWFICTECAKCFPFSKPKREVQTS